MLTEAEHQANIDAHAETRRLIFVVRRYVKLGNPIAAHVQSAIDYHAGSSPHLETTKYAAAAIRDAISESLLFEHNIAILPSREPGVYDGPMKHWSINRGHAGAFTEALTHELFQQSERTRALIEATNIAIGRTVAKNKPHKPTRSHTQ